MAQGYTYKVLVNITKGLSREQMTSIPVMKALYDPQWLQSALEEVEIGRSE